MTTVAETIRTFDSAVNARRFRHEYGVGGWIFEDEADGSAILFPPSLYPAAIFHHPMTKGRIGRLIGSQ